MLGEARRLRLVTGDEVPVIVHAASGVSTRPKCLLLHGNPGSLCDWAQLIPELEGTADIAALDLPGFGRSLRHDPSARGVGLAALSNAALATLDALGWSEPCFLIGHSHGAAVAQTLAAMHPERIAGIVLLASLGAPAHAGYRLLGLPGVLLLARFASWLFRAHSLLSVVQVVQERPCELIWQAAPRVRCPTLFIHGERDALVPARFARAIHACILRSGGDSTFETLPRAGHLLPKQQAPQLAERITVFLGRYALSR